MYVNECHAKIKQSDFDQTFRYQQKAQAVHYVLILVHNPWDDRATATEGPSLAKGYDPISPSPLS